MTFRTANVVIDCQALVNNFNIIKQLAPNTKMLAILKANAYGHGLETIARALPLADAFGVARIDEALALRAAGIIQPIMILEGVFSQEDLAILAANNLQTTVHSLEQLDAICKAQLIRPLKVWLKIDTGMHRLGISPDQFDHFHSLLSQCDNVQQPLILMSHLACADDIENDKTSDQIVLFQQLTSKHSEEKSLAHSAALYAWPDSHFDWVRPGLMLYGISPMLISKETASKSDPLVNITPVMTLQSSLIAVRAISAGESVGYGSAWTCQNDTTIGVVAIGYGDGYPRHAVNGTPVLINGRRVPIVGRVSMDMITVDLSYYAQDSVGDLVILWGKDLPVEEIARCATTIPYELLCKITPRVKINVISSAS
ncbi:MAG: alanine racemase [Alteromonadaceae bacterium]|jgi:alanine racemase